MNHIPKDPEQKESKQEMPEEKRKNIDKILDNLTCLYGPPSVFGISDQSEKKPVIKRKKDEK